MGNIFSSWINDWVWKHNCHSEIRVLMLGLDGAGKTTILYQLKLEEVVTTIPTIGFCVETLSYKNVNLCIWDIGGQDKIRALWRHYYQNTRAIIYVVDSNDRERIEETKNELQKLLAEEELKEIPLLIYANKTDLPQSLTLREITETMKDIISEKDKRKFYIQACSAISKKGIYEGLDWVNKALRTNS